ncbi:MAG: hypothetical protein IPO90_01915 [Flavobacteriales bacterium]|nr:hypothetical protein [Flavobacteriales bacterium]
MRTGVSIYFQPTLEDLGDRIREVQPHVFTAVPRLLEKIAAYPWRKVKRSPVSNACSSSGPWRSANATMCMAVRGGTTSS